MEIDSQKTFLARITEEIMYFHKKMFFWNYTFDLDGPLSSTRNITFSSLSSNLNDIIFIQKNEYFTIFESDSIERGPLDVTIEAELDCSFFF